MAEELNCDGCGAPGQRTFGRDASLRPVPDGVWCSSCLKARNKALPREMAPEAWAKALDEVRAKRASAKAPAEKRAPAAPPPADQIDAAVQRLLQEAQRIPHPAPHPTSPNWIGRDLEREGWARKLLVAAVAQALDAGDLVAAKYRDGWGNRKNELRAAAPGQITFDDRGDI